VLRLITLGGLALYRDGTALAGSATQRLRLALLARVASAGPRGVRRDALISLLWPDSDPDRGRHSLEQALHAARRALSVDALFTGTAVICLNPDVATSDVADFDAAVGRGAADRAVELYAGAFLDGFHLPSAPEFEQWVASEAARCARQYAAALETLARTAAERADHVTAVHWWRRLSVAEPLSARVAVAVIEALVASGDRSGALQHASVHASLVRAELDSPADPEIVGWIARLKLGAPPTGPRASPLSVTTPGQKAGSDAEQRLRSRLGAALAERYTLATRTDASKTVITFAAVDRHTSGPVHVHVVRPWISAMVDVQHAARMLASVGAVDDPCVVPVLSVGIADEDLLYFVGPPRSDPSLRDRLAREGALPVSDAIRIAVDVCTALACAEDHRVRHGDLRPRHIALGARRAAVGAFGLVDALRWTPESSPVTTAVTLGAPAYLSPDVLAGQSEADARSDVYAVGCIVFEMLTGAPPFAAGGTQALVARKLTGAAPHVRDVRPSVPDAVDRLLTTCLAPLAADRYQTAAALRAAVTAL
jgi:DNA-binding SARP family transcriptional activator